jgi:hypothetical protein
VTPGLLAMLAGAFGVPLALLWAGHRLRRRPARWRAAFWGALVAHLVAIPLALWGAMVPAAEWAPTDAGRGALGFWALLVLPAVGAAVGALRGRDDEG